MDEASRADAANAAQDLTNFMHYDLRRKFPWLKTEALNTILDSHSSDLFKQLIEQEPVMAESRNRTNFFSLSAELRNHIYEDALIPHGGEILVRHRYVPPYCRAPTLLQANKEIRGEATSIYYGSNAFAFQWDGFEDVENLVGAVRKWLESIGTENASKVKELRVLYRETGIGPVRLIPSIGRPAQAPETFVTKAGLYETLSLKGLGITEKQFRAYYAAREDGLNLRIDREIL